MYNIAFDIDGVVADLFTSVDKYLKKDGKKLVIDSESNFVIENEEYDQVYMHKCYDDIINIQDEDHELYVHPYANVANKINDLYIKNNKIPFKFISARTDNMLVSTTNWLNKYLPDVEKEIICCNHRNNKVHYLNNVNIFIEDQFENAIALYDKVDVMCLIKRVWNYSKFNIDQDLSDNIILIDDISDINEMILNLDLFKSINI